MTSKITQKTYDDFTSSNRTVINIGPFYISEKSGTVCLEKLPSEFPSEFKFTWFRNNTSTYVEYCIAHEDKRNYITFVFSSFNDLSKRIDNQHVCLYHSICQDKCSAFLITSPIDKCAICLKDKQMHMFEETRCEHRFCLDCLDTYVKSKLNYTHDKNEHVIDGGIPCPVCRRNLQLCYNCEQPQFNCICK